MIIVIHHNPQNNQVSLMFEGGTPEAAEQLMDHLSQQMKNQRAQQSNGHQQRPSGLILPPTIVPKDMKGGIDNA